MLTKLSKYTFEIVAGIVIFGVIIYFLPSNNVSIPDIGELKVENVDLAFVMDEEDQSIEGEVTTDTGDVQDSVGTGSTQGTWTIDNQDGEIILEDNTSTGSFTIISEAVVNEGKDSPPPTTTWDNDETTNTEIAYENCVSPRGTTVSHGDSIIAYAQRSDDPGTCNVQRRVCTDGTLNGSYEQSSCKEYLWVNPETQEVVTYNTPTIDPAIQPQSISKTNRSSSNFSSSLPNSSSRSSGGPAPSNTVPTRNNQPVTTRTSSSTSWDGSVCATPRWEEVRNGQFVKAYRSDKGFSNMPCEVELRYCVQTRLDWAFQYPSCQHYDIAVEDYLQGHFDPDEPSMMQLVEILHGSADEIPANYGQKPSIRDRITWFFGRLF